MPGDARSSQNWHNLPVAVTFTSVARRKLTGVRPVSRSIIVMRAAPIPESDFAVISSSYQAAESTRPTSHLDIRSRLQYRHVDRFEAIVIRHFSSACRNSDNQVHFRKQLDVVACFGTRRSNGQPTIRRNRDIHEDIECSGNIVWLHTVTCETHR